MDETSEKIKVAILETKIDGLKEALKLQAIEYERRLSELNHAHTQATTDKAKFLDKDLFYSKMDENTKWRNEMDQWRSKVIGIATGIGLAAGMAGGSVSAIILKLLAK